MALQDDDPHERQNETADLGQYLSDAYGPCLCEPTPSTTGCHHTNIFGPRSSPGRPRLKRGQENNVLIYSGCFNPPHLGHYSLLRRAFEGSQDLNVIAAVVYPYWTHDGGRLKFEDMWSRVLGAVKRDGFNLKFIEVAGPDHVVPTRVFQPFEWDFEIYRTILSNAGREFDLLQPGGQIERMRGYGYWEDAIDYTKAANPKNNYPDSEHEMVEDMERTIVSKPRFTLPSPPSTVGANAQPNEDTDNEPVAVTDALSETCISENDAGSYKKTEHGSNIIVPERRKIKVCRRIGDSETWVRFVPADATPLTFSSTRIRRILEGGFPKDGHLAGTSWTRSMLEDEALDSVKEMVLHPEVLARIMLQRHGIQRLDEA
ncbi:uncharacterized protein CLUP02_07554 [Colletotrichum lupini]|uniref:Cytidyltransferase-like domain-containing protein n=1 Tax=Colletotrichum lupini TaxID=145971 RepID=A0A9Q8SRT7_9PEZI|nr:uncharacterized protein CLUP02_07554 [Colletotrichum lupini]UQC82068.1 hypothetical protein CLUP02_07554 [Colletotrichum lupini]